MTKKSRIAAGAVTALMLLPGAALAVGSKPGNTKGRMTGGGTIVSKRGVTISHGFELRCRWNPGPNRLEVNWDGGNHFHLIGTSKRKCTDSAGWEEGMPDAGFDTMRVWGWGLLNGEEGATIYAKIGDAGDPGTADYLQLAIYDKDGNRVVSGTGLLQRGGNHQAHER